MGGKWVLTRNWTGPENVYLTHITGHDAAAKKEPQECHQDPVEPDARTDMC